MSWVLWSKTFAKKNKNSGFERKRSVRSKIIVIIIIIIIM